jgi:hypothetical protein
MGSYRVIFEELARLLRIRELARPLGPPLQRRASPQTALELLEQSARRSGYDPTERWSLVLDGDSVIGSVAFYDVATSEASAIGDVVTTVRPSDILSGDLDALSAIRQLAVRGTVPFFVLDGSQLVGTIEYSDLFGAQFRLCLFALTLHLEECALRSLVSRAPDAVAALSESRREKARAVCVMRFGQRGGNSPANLLGGTTFIDKATMLAKLNLVPNISNARLHRLFVKAEHLRNYCAHPSIDVLRTAPIVKQDEFQEFLAECNLVIETLEGIQGKTGTSASAPNQT